ncbi:MAG: lamin tail domain-containing protein [Acidobacteria bacterium]|nr:lamin tail domain-containing protein [Acidobacteriota bacterium]
MFQFYSQPNRIRILDVMAIFVCSFWLCDSVFAQAQSGVVISQIYGAGGNSGAIYRNDFIELFNRGSSAVDLKGWAVHYSSSTGSNWQKTELSGSIAPGKRMLIQQASGGANGAVLPAADIIGSISLASTAGKVVLTSTATSIAAGTVCPSGPAVVDLVGYGTNANCFEGSGPAPAPGSSNGVLRGGDGCVDFNNNTSDFITGTPVPRNSSLPAAQCRTAGAKLEIISSEIIDDDTDGCTQPGELLTVNVVLKNTGSKSQADNQGAELTVWLAPLLAAQVNSCSSGGKGRCFINSSTEVQWNGKADPDETVTISFQAGVSDPGNQQADLCLQINLGYDSNSDGSNESKVSSKLCPAPLCLPAGPGIITPPQSESGDQKSGSLLIYPIYSSRSTDRARENTRISITNIDPQRQSTVRIFFVGAKTASINDAFISLSPAQTAAFLASDFDPDVTGFIIAVSVDRQTGLPVGFNSLIGDVYLRLATGHSANLPAEACAAVSGWPLRNDQNAGSVELKFDGIQYNRMPTELAADYLALSSAENSSMLIVNRIGGDLGSELLPVGRLNVIFHSDAEKASGFEINSLERQVFAKFDSGLLTSAGGLAGELPESRYGWARIRHDSGGAITGAIINHNPGSTGNFTALNHGRNLHRLTFASATGLKFPVRPPG